MRLFPDSRRVEIADREDHIGKVIFFVARGEDDGAQAVLQLQRDLLARDDAQRIEQIAAVEADLQLAAVPGDGAGVVRGADGVRRAEIGHIVAEDAADGAFDLFGDDEADALDGGSQLRDVRGEDGAAVCGDNAAPVDEFALEHAADEQRVTDGEEDVLVAERERDGLVGILQNALDLLETGGGDDEFEGMVRCIFRVPGAAGQPEAVHGDHGDGILRDLHQAAGLDGAGLIFGHGEDRAGDHGLQRGLRHGHAALAVDVRQLGIVLGIHGRDLEEGRARTDGDLLLVVDGDGDHFVRQLPDDIKEQASGHGSGRRRGR